MKITKKQLQVKYNDLEKMYQELNKEHNVLVEDYMRLENKYNNLLNENIDGMIKDMTENKKKMINYIEKRIKCTNGEKQDEYKKQLKKYLN